MTNEQLANIVRSVFGSFINDRCVTQKEIEETQAERDAIIERLLSAPEPPDRSSGGPHVG